MRPYYAKTDEEIEAMILECYAAQDALMVDGIAAIAGEGRRVEYVQANAGMLTNKLRMLEAEARGRGMEIAGQGGAIKVEF